MTGIKKHLKNGDFRMGILLKTFHFKDWKSDILFEWLVEIKKVDKFNLHILDEVFCYLSKNCFAKAFFRSTFFISKYADPKKLKCRNLTPKGTFKIFKQNRVLLGYILISVYSGNLREAICLKEDALAHAVSCEFCEIFKNTFLQKISNDCF